MKSKCRRVQGDLKNAHGICGRFHRRCAPSTSLSFLSPRYEKSDKAASPVVVK